MSIEEPMSIGEVQSCIAALGYNYDDIKVLDKETHYVVATNLIVVDVEEVQEAPDMLSDLEKYTKLLNDPKKEMILRYALGLPPLNQMAVASVDGEEEVKVGPYEISALRDLILELAKIHVLDASEIQMFVIENIVSEMENLSPEEICEQVVARLELQNILPPEGCVIDDLAMILDEMAVELTQAVDLYGELHFVEEDGKLDLVFLFETKDANKIAILNEAVVVAKVKKTKGPSIGKLPPSPHGLLPIPEQKEVEELLKVRNYKKLTLSELKKIAPKAAAHIEELIKELKSGPIGVALGELSNSTDKLIEVVYGLDGLDYAGYIKDVRFATGKRKVKASSDDLLTRMTHKLLDCVNELEKYEHLLPADAKVEHLVDECAKLAEEAKQEYKIQASECGESCLDTEAASDIMKEIEKLSEAEKEKLMDILSEHYDMDLTQDIGLDDIPSDILEEAYIALKDAPGISFDLTDITAENWKKILVSMGVSEDPIQKNSMWVWSGPGIKIHTANDPITGKYAGGNRSDEKDYASYIELYGDKEKIEKAAKMVRDLASVIKG